MRLSVTVAVLVVAALCTPPASAAQRTLDIDLEATSVVFSLGAALHTVHGTMRLRTGKILFDLDTGAAAGEVVFDARATETGNRRRDLNMHREVLESGSYPRISFRPTAVAGELVEGRRNRITLTGLVSVHGSDHLLEIVAEVGVAGTRLSGDASFDVPYVEWGMHDPSGLLLRVDKTVHVTLDVHGTVTP
jgi:polyisoprenoid-binding protein YceI